MLDKNSLFFNKSIVFYPTIWNIIYLPFVNSFISMHKFKRSQTLLYILGLIKNIVTQKKS